MNTFRYVIPILKKNIKRIALGIGILIFVDSLQLIIPKIIQHAINNLEKPGFTHVNLLYSALFILLLAVLTTIFKYVWRILLIGNAWQFQRSLRQSYYNHLMKLSQTFYNKQKTGELMARATNDIQAVRMMFGFGFVMASDTLFLSVASFLLMIQINPKLTLLSILPLPIMTVFIIFMGKRIHVAFKRVQTSFADLSGMVQENISGIRVVKAFVQEESEVDKMADYAGDYVKKNLKLVSLQAAFHPFMGMIISISMGMVLVFGGAATIKGDMNIGEYVAFYSYLGTLVWPMIAIGWIVNLYQNGTASLKRLNEILDVEPDITDEKADPELKSIEGEIEIKNLVFRYRDDLPNVFDDISIQLKKGDTLAIVGRTGCGKSTLVNQLLRVYNPPEGAFFIDGKELYRYPLEVLRNNIAIVPQEIFLFSDTIANNIAFGRPGATRADIERVAKLASVHDDIVGFKEGYETTVGERGVTLSGGQKQRIAMARAFLCDPAVLILDDSLSAVDTRTEKEILEQIIELRKERTTIIIAHRISSIQHAEQTVVLENGKIAERGNHEELMKLGGIYAELYEKQQIEEKLKG